MSIKSALNDRIQHGGSKDDIIKRRGDWIQTWSGRKFWPIDPRPEDVFIEDISNSLGKICRFNGHCSEFYSVAEHSVYVSNYVDCEYSMAGLLHDAAEAYLSDITRPVKAHLTNYSFIEKKLLLAIYERFDIDFKHYRHVKKIDMAVLADERSRLMKRLPYHAWSLPEKPLGIKINCWCPEKASIMFHRRFLELSSGGEGEMLV